MTSGFRADAEVRPPATDVGVLGWLRANLFGSLPSGLATIVVGGILVVVAWLLAGWAINDARWGVVTSNMRLFLVGLYPPAEIWRVAATLALLSLLAGLSAGTWHSGTVRTMAVMLAAGQATVAALVVVSGLGPVGATVLIGNAALVVVPMLLVRRWAVPRRWLLAGWVLSLAVTFVLLRGLEGAPLVPTVETRAWGGLLLTILLAVVGIVASFPIGVALALGRRSRLPVIRALSTMYIEVVRAVPLITILFMAVLIVPLFLPEGLRIDNIVRAMAGFTVFSSAYLAENVRGGLQAIPAGQVEAAQAIGLRGYQVNLYIVLPQALRITIPANVGLFISLLKDTTLVVIISLLELLGIGRAVLAQSEWLGAAFEVYVFVGAIFFVLSYTLSRASYRLEEELGVGVR